MEFKNKMDEKFKPKKIKTLKRITRSWHEREVLEETEMIKHYKISILK